MPFPSPFHDPGLLSLSGTGNSIHTADFQGRNAKQYLTSKKLLVYTRLDVQSCLYPHRNLRRHACHLESACKTKPPQDCLHLVDVRCVFALFSPPYCRLYRNRSACQAPKPCLMVAIGAICFVLYHLLNGRAYRGGTSRLSIPSRRVP